MRLCVRNRSPPPPYCSPPSSSLFLSLSMQQDPGPPKAKYSVPGAPRALIEKIEKYRSDPSARKELSSRVQNHLAVGGDGWLGCFREERGVLELGYRVF